MSKIMLAKCVMFSLLSCVACKINQQAIVGEYGLKTNAGTRLQLHADHTFELVKTGLSPYLHSLDHADERFFSSRGTWAPAAGHSIVLTSVQLRHPVVPARIAESRARLTDISSFVFYDIYGDTVRILYVRYPDQSTVGRLHGPMASYQENALKNDTLEFHFYGYSPWLFVRSQPGSQAYQVTLLPEYKPMFFEGDKFKFRDNELIGSDEVGVFLRRK